MVSMGKKIKSITVLLTLAMMLMATLPAKANPQATTPNSQTWTTQTIDTGNAQSLTLDTKGFPHITYTADGQVRYAEWTGLKWIYSIVGAGESSSLALDSNDDPHIAYSNGTNLKYASWTGTQWSTQTLETLPNNTLDLYVCTSSLKLDSNDNPQIIYAAKIDSIHWFYALKLVTWSGSAWDKETIDNDIIRSFSLAIDSHNHPHISYYIQAPQYEFNGVWYIEKTESRWSERQYVGNNMYPSLSLDASDNPRISYTETLPYQTGNNIWYAKLGGSTWINEAVENDPGFGLGASSLAIDSAGNPHIVYTKGNDLRYAQRGNSSWITVTVSQDCSGGAQIALDSLNIPNIVYTSNGLVKYARAQPTYSVQLASQETPTTTSNKGTITFISTEYPSPPTAIQIPPTHTPHPTPLRKHIL